MFQHIYTQCKVEAYVTDTIRKYCICLGGLIVGCKEIKILRRMFQKIKK